MERYTSPSGGIIPKWGAARQLYERAVREENLQTEVQLRLNGALSVIRDHTSFDPKTRSVIHGNNELVESTRDMIQHQAETLNPDTFDSEKWGDYFRTKHYAGFFDAMAVAPLAFRRQHGRAYRKLREEISDGIYGVTGELLEEALDLYDTATARDFTQADITNLHGAINELTDIALINRDQSLNYMALPSMPVDDLTEATDIEFWHFTESGKGVRTPIQAKSYPARHDLFQVPQDGFLITAVQTRNLQFGAVSHRTSRLIVKELAATMTPEEREQLQFDHAQFMQYVHENAADAVQRRAKQEASIGTAALKLSRHLH